MGITPSKRLPYFLSEEDKIEEESNMLIPSQDVPTIIDKKFEEKEIDKNKELVETAISKAISHPIYWDERDKYSQKELDLLEKIDAQIFGKSIHVTEVGTVITKIAHHPEEEVLFDDFIKDLTVKVNKEESAVKYNSEENAFYLVEKEKCLYVPKMMAYKIDVNEKSMSKYAFGTYDKVTSALHNLYLKSMTNEEKKNMLAKKEQEIEEVINKINTTHEKLSLAEASIYLGYLEEKKNTNKKDIKDSIKEIAISTMYPVFTGATIGMGGSTPVETIAAGFLGACLGASLNDGRLIFLHGVDGIAIIPGHTTIKYIKESIEKIKAKSQDNRMIKIKESTLKEIENLDRAVPANSYSIEEINNAFTEQEKLELLNITNRVKIYLDKVTNKIALLDSVEDKKKFFAEVKEIMAEYDERYISIASRDKNVINILADDFEELKMDTFEKIADLEFRVHEVKQRDDEIKQVLDETKMLEEKIDGFSQLDNLDLELQKVRDNANKKVKVKKLERK